MAINPIYVVIKCGKTFTSNVKPEWWNGLSLGFCMKKEK